MNAMRTLKRGSSAHFMFVLLLVMSMLGNVSAGCLDRARLVGVNLSGGEFGADRIPGVFNKDYIYPSRTDLAYFKTQGATIVRVPFLWERVQPRLSENLDQAEVERLRNVVKWAYDMDVCVLLDLHNYGGYRGHTLGSVELPASTLIDVWKRLHFAFGNPDETAFGLMNEPSAVPVGTWMQIAQQTVLALRDAGAQNLVLVPSGRWSGAHEWDKAFDATSAANFFRRFEDPLNRFVIELHQYADANYSGTGSSCIETARLKKIFASVTTWAKQEKKRFFLGEFGVSSSAECMVALQAMLDSMEDKEAWLGWTYWSAGPWWGNYPFSVQPINGNDTAQFLTLKKYLKN